MIALKRSIGTVVANFIRDNIICLFGIPKPLLYDNGTPFINMRVRRLFDYFGVDQMKSSLYYP